MRKKHIKILIIIFLSLISYSGAYSQAGGFAGTFARLGFGARGLSMGNAMVANVFTDVSGYYNPALSTFQEEGFVNIGYTFLSMDRQLNFLGFAKKFEFPNQQIKGAGISISWLNSGVSDIDGRDNDTRQIGNFSTFDNQFSLGMGFIISDNVSVGVAFKYYYSKLFDDVTSTSVAFDAGIIVRPQPNLSFGLTVRDLNAKSEWNTLEIYGSSFGNVTKDKFPTLINLGGSYLLPNNIGVVSVEAEYQKNPTSFIGTFTVTEEMLDSVTSDNISFKLGGEVFLTPQISIRAGVERIDFGSDDVMGNIKPSFGVGFYKNFGKTTKLGLDYSFQLEPYTHDPIQNISIGFKFN
jgi:hypothetical protein